MTQDTDRQKIRRAFRHLRRSGWVARMNFRCCQGCALYDLSKANVTDRYVFFHQQEGEAFQKVRGIGKFTDTLHRDLFLYWGNTRSPKAIIDALRSQGLRVSWRGTQRSAIQVHASWT